MEQERPEIGDEDHGATLHGRHLVSASKAQRQADATMARLRGERAAARRERIREARTSGRRAWNGPAEQQ